MLDILGICEGLRWLAKEFEKRTGIPCDLSIEPNKIEVDPERSIAIYRIYQETLTNVARHAAALNVQSSFVKKTNHLILKVRDNGKGMDRNKVENPMSLGLIGIRERALVWGGRTQIQTSPGKGTEIIVTIPLDEA
jgi:signal transduction histidine kinase